MSLENSHSFFTLLRAGLWEHDVQISNDYIDYLKVLQLADEHAVTGIIAAGIEHIKGDAVPKDVLLHFVGIALQIERRNIEIDHSVEYWVNMLNNSGIEVVLVKGQGVAQCYERPLLRSPGDIDFLLTQENYFKAKEFFSLITDTSTRDKKKHQDMMHSEFYINNSVVELHGTLHPNLSPRINDRIDKIQSEMFDAKKYRCWRNGKVNVLLPEPTLDVIFVFIHILQHFFESGIGLRQICDLCRLLWKYDVEIDRDYLEECLNELGLMTEWKSFASLMVNSLGFPKDGMPLYDSSYNSKGERVLSFVLEAGNFGRNFDHSYTKRYHRIIRKSVTLIRQFWYSLRKMSVFPVDTVRFFSYYLRNGFVSFINGD